MATSIRSSATISGRTEALARIAVGALAAATAIAILPLPPQIAHAGLDASWLQALQVAALRGLDFGTEIVFTYGPLGFVHARIYWPELFAVTLAFWALLAAGLLDAWSGLARRTGLWALYAWPVFAAACSFAAIYAHDMLVIAYLMLWVLQVDAGEPGPRRVALHAALAGVLALVKLTFTLAAGLAVAAVVAILLLRRAPSRAGLAAAVALATFLGGWLALSQPLSSLAGYAVNGYEIVAGFGEAMTRRGPRWEMQAYGAIAAAMLGGAGWAALRRRDATMAVATAFAGLMAFLTWKQAFTRHDEHALIAFAFLALAGAALAARMAGPARGIPRAARFVAYAALVYALVGFQERTQGHALQLLANVAKRPYDSLPSLADVAAGMPALRAAHERALATLRADDPLPALAGTVDVYSHDQASAIAHGLRWDPRPVFQSYNAYTAPLAELNRRHLAGARAPDHLLVRIQPIDNRLAALEDGASWLAMLERYALREEGAFVVLDRQPAPAPATLRTLAATTGSGWRELPRDAGMLLATVDIDGGSRGLAGALRRPVVHQIQLRLAGGKVTAPQRFLRWAAQAPFVLSPLVESDAGFAGLFAPCGPGSAAPVEALRILGADNREVAFTLRLQVVEKLPRFAASVASGPRAMACDLRLVSGPDALRTHPFWREGEARGLNAHPPATFRLERAARRVEVCTRLAARVLRDGGSDGYVLRLVTPGGKRAAAEMRVSPEALKDGKDACIEARFDRARENVELQVAPGGHDSWDWVYITRLAVDG